MNKHQFKSWFFDETAQVLADGEQEEIFKMLLEAYEDLQPLDWMDWNAEGRDELKWQKAIAELKTHKPIQQILGHAYFFEKAYSVNEHVLIPRPETEELVQWIKDEIQQPSQIIDIGTGSACIAIELALHFPKAQVLGVDISNEALELAAQNAQALEATNVSFEQYDILEQEKALASFDVIVSNPPYICKDEALENRVLDYEPHLALFVSNDDPLQFYKAIEKFASRSLANEGKLFFECHADHARDVAAYLEERAWKVVLKRDIYTKERMIKAIRD